jgi:hypothetical protein
MRMARRPAGLPSIMPVNHFDGGQGKLIFEQAVLPLKIEGLDGNKLCVACQALTFDGP